MESITTLSELDRAFEASLDAPIVFFIHSNSCPISAAAYTRLEALSPAVARRTYRVVVQTARDVSDRIEEALGVPHESPQVILVVGGESRYEASHGDISVFELEEYFAKAVSSGRVERPSS